MEKRNNNNRLRVGILTGGGDCPGLNAVIYGALLRASEESSKQVEVVGIIKGWKVFNFPKSELTKELVDHYTQVLDIGELDDLHTKGGTMLYTSRTNPFKAVAKLKDPQEREQLTKKIGEDLASKFQDLNIDALIAVGGDDTCGVAAAMYKYGGAHIVACPKTIDNDLAGTDFTFGFFSGAQLASNTLDNLTTTAHSHQRIFVVEVMGRDAGWLTLYSGLSSGADIILLPEVPFDFEHDVVDVLKKRANAGYKFHIIACSEGAYPNPESLERDFTTISQKDIEALPKDSFGNPILSKLNMASKIEKELQKREDIKQYFNERHAHYEIRSVVLGHTMRSGTPNVYDRVLGLRYGYHAMDYVIQGQFGKMTSLQGTEIEPVDIVEGSKKRLIPLDSDLLKIKEAMISVKHKSKEKLFK
ncbi:MAG: ATP-dependent 6-phosphofructokinase [Candidatus Lokiarchaeota archaeon]|nr:ATP-dependent 6-phosphofructokinase [Candidatus Harpocratesius repetitus]